MQATINLLRTSPTAKRFIIQSTPSFKPSINLHTSRNLPRQLRSYHSHEHADPPLPYNAQETAILNAALEHVPEHGFTETSLAMGSRDAGYLDITTNLFPNGAFDVIKFHLIKERSGLKDRVDFANRSSLTMKDGRDGKGPGVGQKIRTLCVERLKRNEPIIHRWQEALAVMSLLPNIKPSLSELFNLADEMWYLAGDDSVDMSWYTKRTTLAGVYASTEVYMTQDHSEGFRNTWSFLDRRLTDVYTVGNTTKNVSQFLGYSARNALNVLRSKGVKI